MDGIKFTLPVVPVGELTAVVIRQRFYDGMTRFSPKYHICAPFVQVRPLTRSTEEFAPFFDPTDPGVPYIALMNSPEGRSSASPEVAN